VAVVITNSIATKALIPSHCPVGGLKCIAMALPLTAMAHIIVIIVSEVWEPFQLALALDSRGNMLPY
jgi:hypothetical protein